MAFGTSRKSMPAPSAVQGIPGPYPAFWVSKGAPIF
jgi:hypothetical protein